MRELIAELYNKVVTFFQTDKEEGNSKVIASNRLKLVLMQDRTNLDSSTLEKMRVELVEVISKYVEIDKEEFAVNLENAGESVALMLNIPVIRAKSVEEIEALEKEDDNSENIDNKEETSIVENVDIVDSDSNDKQEEVSENM